MLEECSRPLQYTSIEGTRDHTPRFAVIVDQLLFHQHQRFDKNADVALDDMLLLVGNTRDLSEKRFTDVIVFALLVDRGVLENRCVKRCGQAYVIAPLFECGVEVAIRLLKEKETWLKRSVRGPAKR